MKTLRDSTRCNPATAAACVDMLAVGLMLAPSADAASGTTTSSTTRVKAPRCTFADGDTFGQGTKIAGVPPKWKYRNTPYAGARYDSCANVVKFYYGNYSNPLQPAPLPPRYATR